MKEKLPFFLPPFLKSTYILSTHINAMSIAADEPSLPLFKLSENKMEEFSFVVAIIFEMEAMSYHQ